MNEQAKGELLPGGLAMIVGSVHEDSPYIGTVVELVREVMHIRGPAWEIKADIDPEKDRALTIHLLPINPSAGPIETTQERDLCQIQ